MFSEFLFLVKLSSIMPLIQVQELSRMMLQHFLCFSFVGPWDPSQGLYNPDEKIKLWLFLPGCHSSISDTAQASVSKLRDARYRARAILENPTDKTKVHLIYANVTYNDILLREELESLTANYPDQFKIYYVLNQPPETWDGGVGFVSKDMIQAHCPAPASDIQSIFGSTTCSTIDRSVKRWSISLASTKRVMRSGKKIAPPVSNKPRFNFIEDTFVSARGVKTKVWTLPPAEMDSVMNDSDSDSDSDGEPYPKFGIGTQAFQLCNR